MSRGQRNGSPRPLISVLWTGAAIFFQVAQLTSRGWVDPVPDPLLRKSGSAGNRTRDLCICSQKLWPLDHRGGRWMSNVCLIVALHWDWVSESNNFVFIPKPYLQESILCLRIFKECWGENWLCACVRLGEFRELLSNNIVYFLYHVLHVRTGHIPQTFRYRFNFLLNSRNWVSLHKRLR